MSSGRKRRKSQSNQDGSEDIAETLAKSKEYNNKLEGKPARKLHPKGSKKGCVKGKGGPDNSHSNYRGVRQRTWGKWVAEIRQPNGGPRLWLGTFGNALQAAQAYDEAAKAIYGPAARLNIPDSSFLKESFEASSSSLQLQTTSCSYSTTTSTYSEDSKANIDGEGESRIDDSKEDTVHMNEGIGLNAEQYYSSDEMFDVDELLGILDSTPHGFGQLELSDYAEIPQFEKPPDILLNQLQNPDAKLLESLQYWEQAPLGVDIGLDFLRPGRQEDCGHTLDELGFLNFDPDFGDLM